jgi:hypothetical protein
MRRIISGALVALIYGSAASAQTCVQPPEQTAFNIIAMKSALMVGALSCGQSEQYDAFMTQFQPYILAEQHIMDGYFQRSTGMYGQTQEDDYVTQLANTQSETSLQLGKDFCGANAQIFSDVLALSTPDDLNQYVAAHTPSEPIPLVACPTTAASVSQPDPAEAAEAAKQLMVSQPPPVPEETAAPVVKQAAATKPVSAKKAHKSLSLPGAESV